MIRNKNPLLIQSKQRQTGRKFKKNQEILVNQPWWFQQYYQQKQTLQQINANNKNITIAAKKYQVNPSIYSLRQVQKLITDNCQLIQGVDRWTGSFKYSQINTAMQKHQKALIKNIQTLLAEQVASVFQNKQLISSVNNSLNEINLQRSKIFSGNSHSPYLNQSNSQFENKDRNSLFQEVSEKISNLNVVMKRMNALVASQGDLVNRIDQNLASGKQAMVKANEQLETRTRKQQGVGEFSFEGKVNKVITGLYIINIIILVMFVLKHLIF